MSDTINGLESWYKFSLVDTSLREPLRSRLDTIRGVSCQVKTLKVINLRDNSTACFMPSPCRVELSMGYCGCLCPHGLVLADVTLHTCSWARFEPEDGNKIEFRTSVICRQSQSGHATFGSRTQNNSEIHRTEQTLDMIESEKKQSQKKTLY